MKNIKQVVKRYRLLCCILVLFVLLAGCGSTKLPAQSSVAETQGFEETTITEGTAAQTAEEETAVAGETVSVGETATGETLGVGETASEEETAAAKETNVAEETPPTISLLMVGDILLHTPVEEAAKQEDGSYNFDAIFANMQEEIQAADLAIVNQEVILGGEEMGISGYPAFNAPFAVGDALVEAGFDVICHGTNHALDKGRKGLLNCINFWRQEYPQAAVLGIHDSQESQDEIYIYEQDGIKVAILNFTYGTNGIAMSSDMPYAVDMLEEKKVTEAIRKAEELADFTLVCPHWGTEYQLEQSSAQEKWARLFAENGVDLVLGTHPHVIQPIEWVVDEETGHEMLVYYSLGNFVNWTSSSGAGIANRMVGGMAQVILVQEEDRVVIAEYDVEPVVCHLEKGINGVTVYKLEDYTTELGAVNQIVHQDAGFSLEYCEQLCQKVWPEF